MMNPNDRLAAFIRLGKIVSYLQSTYNHDNSLVLNPNELKATEELSVAISSAIQNNPWFTVQNMDQAINGLSVLLQEEALERWFGQYNCREKQKINRVGVVMAGNIPAVGFHDFLCVLITGNIFVGKLATNDRFLLPAIAQVLIAINNRFIPFISFTTERLTGFDAVIATGSTNTSRYFEYYFGKYPNIIRSNRNSVAILTGDETSEELQLLATDVFSYFGLGCRNVSLIFVPEEYNFGNLLEIFSDKPELFNHSKYFNNYEYNKAILLINSIKHFDNNSVLLKEDASISSAVSMLHYQFYNNLNEVNQWIVLNKDKIQCVVSKSPEINGSIPLGKSQYPDVTDYADGIDTMDFLLNL
ncbi:MAG: acyl-CoA reductase [Bacteroidales bacterium]|nr:acyl-CoA reductase [Bacteroidales bacterium]